VGGNWNPSAVPLAEDDVVFPLVIPVSTINTITLGAGSLANSLRMQGDYLFTGGTLGLTSGGIYINRANMLTLDSQLTGSTGLNLTGGGALRLGNVTNNYTGITQVTNGTLIISRPTQLGTSTSPVVVAGSATRGFGGGTLLLEGDQGTGMNFTRDLTIMGYGPITDRSAALASVGYNTISGNILYGGGSVATAIQSAGGMLTLAGNIAPLGTGQLRFGSVNTVGIGSYHLTGWLSGTTNIEKLGAGTLILDPGNASSFSGNVLINAGSVRVAHGSSLGTSTANGALTLGGGVGTLELRTDAPDSFATRRVQMNTSNTGTLLLDHAVGSNLINQTVSLAPLTLTAGTTTRTMTINSRNGYGVTFEGTSASAAIAGSNIVVVNANGLVTFNGNFWNNTSTTARTLTMTVNTGAHVLITGDMAATGAEHILTKTGVGTLTILGGNSTYTGATNINTGTVAIPHFGSINNNSAALNLGATTTMGALNVIGNDLDVGQTTPNKAFNLAGTTGGGTILANQTGNSPGLVINGGIAAGGVGIKALTLGGSNLQPNEIRGAIVNSSGGVTSLYKTGSNTWVLSGANTYTGATLINNGTLKIQDTFSGTSTNVLADNAVLGLGFALGATTEGSAGGLFHYAGANGAASVESIGNLITASGAGTVRVTAGEGGTATLNITSMNVVPVPVTLTTALSSTGSTIMTVSSTAGLVPGMRLVGGTGAGTYIVSITNGTQLVVSATQINHAVNAEFSFVRVPGGSSVNFDPDFASTITLGGVTTAGFLNGYSYFNGADFAFAPNVGIATLRAPIYFGPEADSGFVLAGMELVSGNHNLVAGLSTSNGSIDVRSLKIMGDMSPVVSASNLTISSDGPGSSGGILLTGGSATITGTGVNTPGGGELVIRVDQASDILYLNSPITSATTGGLTKTGAGTLVISQQNNHTTGGATNLLEGKIQLAPGGRLSANTVNLIMRQGTEFDLNGISVVQTATTSSVGQLMGMGLVTNTSMDPVVFATAGSGGIFNGTIHEVAGQISYVKMGTTTSQTFNGIHNYTGSTTIGVPGNGTTGNLQVTSLSNIGEPSGIGRGDATDTASNAASLIFGGTTGGLVYAGTESVSTDRLFTLAGSVAPAGATITNNGINNAALIFSNTNPIAFGSTFNQLLRLSGSSISDNWFYPQIINNIEAGAITSLTKTGAGLWILGNENNNYTGITIVNDGVLQAQDGSTLPSASGLVFAATSSTTAVFQSSGTFTRDLASLANAGPNTVTWSNTITTGGGGFAASTDKLVVAIGGLDSPTPLVWGTEDGFLVTGTGTGSRLILNSTTSLAEVDFRNAIDLNGATRTITVNENTSTFTDYATLSGVISNSGAGIAGLTKNGNGTLQLLGANTYNGVTSFTVGTLIVNSLGNSATPGPSSLGDSTTAHTPGSALTLGNAGTTPANLQYIGPGEVSDRMIRINSTTGSVQIHADGTGPLILTNVVNDMAAGAKTLVLRGSNSFGNMITSNLGNNGGNLTVTVDGGASWILSGNNTYSGNTNVSAGSLGVGSDTALGSANFVLNSGSVFAYGGDRTITNPVTLTANTATAFIGDHSLTLSPSNGLLTMTGTTSSLTVTTTNNMTAGQTLILDGDATSAATAARTWSINGSGNTVFTGNILTTGASGTTTVALSYSGNGTLLLEGRNTTGGNTTISNAAARVTIVRDDVFGTGTAVLTSGTLLSAGGDRTIANNVTHGGTFIIGGEDKFTFNGTWLNNTGNRTLTINTSAGVELAGEVRLSEHATSARTLTINGVGDVLISGAITNGVGTGASSITYSGNGTLTLTAANSYTGSTTLNNANGVLRLDGNGKLGALNVTVNAGSLEMLSSGLDQTVGGLLTMGSSTSTYAEISIGAGRTLTLNGGVTYTASNAATANPDAALISGPGTLHLAAAETLVTIADNLSAEVDMSWEMARLTGNGTLVKAGAGTLDIRNIGSNEFTGSYQVNAGAILGLGAFDNNLVLNGGTFESSITFTRALGAGDNQVQWGALGGGFSAYNGNLSVTLGSAPNPLVWGGVGGTPFFAAETAPLIFGSATADSEVDFTHNIDFNGGSRTVSVVNNLNVETDKAVLSGNLTNGSLIKTGNGILELSGTNNLTGPLTVAGGFLQFSTAANLTNASIPVALTGGTLEYIGAGNFTHEGPVNVSTATSGISNISSNGGTLKFDGNVLLAASIAFNGNSPIDISGTFTGSAGNRTLTVNNTDSVTFGNINLSDTTTARTMTVNVVSPDAVVTVNGVIANGLAGTAASNFYKQGEGSMVLNGANTFSGAFILYNGLLTLNAPNTGSGLQLGGGAIGPVSGDFARPELFLNADFTLNTSLIYLNANNSYTAVIDGNGTAGINLNATRTFEIRPSLNASLAAVPTPDLIINVPIANGTATSGVTKSRNGTLVFSANNTYTGTTTINEGILRLDNSVNAGSKMGASANLTFGGGTLELMGHASTPVTQSAALLTVGAGFNRILVDASAGAETILNITGALTSTAVGRSADFTLIGGGAAIQTNGTWALTDGILGGWATFNSSSFATIDGTGKVVSVLTTQADDVSSWTTGQHIADSAGFTGTTVNGLRIGSLAFQADAASTLSLGGILDIASGGIIVSPSVAAHDSLITGGQLLPAGGHFFLHQHNTGGTLTIASELMGGTVTKNGLGEVILDSASNNYTGATRVNKGILSVMGGNAVGDYSALTLDPVIGVTFRLLADETTGYMTGGGVDGGNVDIGTHTLTLNQTQDGTMAGQLIGSGTLVKNGTGILTFNTIASTNFTGNLVINAGQVTLGNRQIANFTFANSVTLNSGTLLLDFNGGNESSPNKINNSATVTLINTGGIDGLRGNNNRHDASKAETVGAMTLLGGANTITADQVIPASALTADRYMTITAASMTRNNYATLLVRGPILGTTVAGTAGNYNGGGRIVSTAAPVMVGGAGLINTTTISIVPWAIGANSTTGLGESFVTYAATTGFRPLNLQTEYEQLAAAGGVTAANNVRLSTGGTVTLNGSAKTMNSLLVDSLGTLHLDGAGGSLDAVSGAFLFTGEHGIRVSGFSGITGGAVGPLQEYIMHVVNSSAEGVTLDSPLTSTGGRLTKSGNGLLILGATGSTWSGQTTINQGALQIDSLDKLGSNGTGGLLLSGGTLRFGGVFDPSQINVSLGVGSTALVQTTVGGTFDTNGFDITLANSIGRGGNGGFTKTGAGSLTFNAAANYLGDTTINGGSIVYGVTNALPATTSLIFTGAALDMGVDMGGFNTTLGGITMNGNGTLNVSSSLTVTGTLLNVGATRTLTIDGGGTTTFEGPVILSNTTTSRTLVMNILEGSSVIFNGAIHNGPATGSALTKYGAGSLEITQPSFYGGTTTIGNSTNLGGTVLVTGAGSLSIGALTLNNGELLLHSNITEQRVTTLTMGGGPVGASALLDIGTGITLSPTAITFSSTNNNGMAVIGGPGTLDLGTAGILVTIGNSTTTEVDMSWEMDRVIGSGLFTKAGAGTLDIRGVTNYNFTGSYQINAGAILGLADSLNNNLILNGGVFESSGNFTRSLGTGDNQVQWTTGAAGGGFAASGGNLIVTLAGAPDPLIWGGTQYFVRDGAPLIFGSTSADGVVDFTNNINLGNANRTINVINNLTQVGGVIVDTDLALLSGDLTNGSITKIGNGVLQLGGNNSFTSPIVINGNGGTLQFTSVSNLGGPDTSISFQAGFLSYVGGTDLTVPNPININPGTAAQTVSLQNLAANGTNGAVVTFTGLIDTGVNILTLAGSGTGIITGSKDGNNVQTGGIKQTGAAADVYVTSGNWTLRGHNVLGDDLVVQGPTAVLNLDGTGIITHNTGTSNGFYVRNGAVANLLALNPFVEPNGLDVILLGDATAGLPGTLNMNNFDLTTPRLDLGQVAAGLSGNLVGTATLTVNTTLNLYRGKVEVNLAGPATAVKNGQGEVIFSGNNSNLTGATTIINGILRLDYANSNTPKIGAGNLNMYGGTLVVDGSDSDSTSETVATLNIGGGAGANTGASSIEVNNGTGQDAQLTVSGITRTTVGGTLDFGLSSGFVRVNTSATNPANFTSLGGWATVNDVAFASIVGGKIDAITSTPKDDVSTWLAGDNVTDASGYTGTLGNSSVNSIRFNASEGSDLTIGADTRFTVTSGGILVTANAGSSSISGGILASDLPIGSSPSLRELVIHQHSTQEFTLTSQLNTSLALSKSGEGTLVVNGYNLYTDQTSINEGTLSIFGGNAIGDRSVVNIKNRPGAILELNNSTETISGLTGGGVDGGLVNIGTGTLHLLNNSSLTRVFIGTIAGSGTLIKSGTNTQELEGNNTLFTGTVIVNRGLLHLDSSAGALTNAAHIIVNAAELLADQDQSSSRDRIGNATVVTVNNTATTRGLWLRNENQNANRADTIGTVVLGSGHNVIQASNNAGSGGTGHIGTLTITNLLRENQSTALLRGQSLGAGTGTRGRITTGALPVGSVGGSGAAASPTITITPYFIGVAGLAGNFTDANLALELGNSFVTWVSSGEGFRPLNLTTEYTLNASGYNGLSGVTTNNVRFAVNPGATLTGGSKTLNSLVIDSSTGAVTLTGGGSDILTLASGALLATTTTPANAMVMDGFSELRTGTGEYLIYVTNATSTLAISSALTSDALLTKAGAGTLILTGANSYTGGTWFNQGLIEVAGLDALGSGGLNFHGGGLRWAASSNFDPTIRPHTLGVGGAYYDTNGNNVTFANAFGGGGEGGFVKLGNGTLTLNAAGNFTGPVSINVGAVVYGVENALPSGTDLTLAGGTLNIGTFDTTLGTLDLLASSTIAGSANLTFTGNVNQSTGSRTLTVSNTGITTFDGDMFAITNSSTTARTMTFSVGTGATLVINSQIVDGTGAGSLSKSGSGTLVLNSENYFTGVTTIGGGTTIIGHGSSLGDASGGLTLTSGTLRGDGGGEKIIARNVTHGGTMILDGDDKFTFEGTWLNNTGNRTLTVNGAGGAELAGQVNLSEHATDARTLTVNGPGNTLISGVISNGTGTGNSALTYSGTGILSFSNANTYSGNTNVTSGTLLVNNIAGSGTGTGAVTVAGAGTLGGMGRISGNVTLNGLLSPGAMDLAGNSIAGQLTVGTITANTGSELFLQIGGATVLDPVAITAYQLDPGNFVVPSSWTSSYVAGQTQHDQLNVTGDSPLTINAIITISDVFLDGFTPAYGDVFHILDWSSLGTTTVGGNYEFMNLPVMGPMSWNTDFFGSHGIIFVVPEPSRMLLLFIGLMGLFFRRRRH
jgi:fibronectin-binding autotransporter adhesin